MFLLATITTALNYKHMPTCSVYSVCCLLQRVSRSDSPQTPNINPYYSTYKMALLCVSYILLDAQFSSASVYVCCRVGRHGYILYYSETTPQHKHTEKYQSHFLNSVVSLDSHVDVRLLSNEVEIFMEPIK